jgi:serine/threonine protein kinase
VQHGTLLELPLVLRMLHQSGAGLHHLHLRGIMHRDLRAANILVASAVPLQLKVTDFGVSHQLSSFTGGGGGGGGGAYSANVGSVLQGGAAMGPPWWMAPEALAAVGTPAACTPPCDMWMFGSLMYEVLTAGDYPFSWIPPAMIERRRLAPSGVELRVPGHPPCTGLLGMSTLAAAAADGVTVEWRVRVDCDASVRALHAVVQLMERCWAVEPARRPNVREATTELAHLLDELEAPPAGRDASSTESGSASSAAGYARLQWR